MMDIAETGKNPLELSVVMENLTLFQQKSAGLLISQPHF